MEPTFKFDDETLSILSGRRRPMRAVELFCGGGLLGIGMALGGVRVVQGYDRDPKAVAACRRNLGHGRVLDLADAEAAVAAIEADLGGRPVHGVVGGPPCTDFSVCGERVEGAAADLSVSYAAVVAALKPAWILMENVPQALKSRAWNGRVRPMLKEAGYGLSHVLVDASFNLVPQCRDRVLVFGFLGLEDGDLDSLLRLAFRRDPFCRSRSVRTRRRAGVKDPFETVVSDVLPDIGTDLLVRRTRNRTQRAVFSIHEPYPTLVAQRRGGQNAETYVPKPADAGPLELAREPTWEEKLAIQGVPDGYAFPEGFTEDDRQRVIGNGVPPILGQQAAWVLNTAFAAAEEARERAMAP